MPARTGQAIPGELSVLVNNAAVFGSRVSRECERRAWALHLNLFCTFWCAQAAFRLFGQEVPSSISSTLQLCAEPVRTLRRRKGGTHFITKGLAKSWGPRSERMVLPGPVLMPESYADDA